MSPIVDALRNILDEIQGAGLKPVVLELGRDELAEFQRHFNAAPGSIFGTFHGTLLRPLSRPGIEAVGIPPNGRNVGRQRFRSPYLSPTQAHGAGSPNCTDPQCPCNSPQAQAQTQNVLILPTGNIQPRKGYRAFDDDADRPHVGVDCARGPVCECGSEKAGSGGHSTWCPKFG